MNGLKLIRTRCNISLSELADALGVSRQQISAWENQVKPISEKRLAQLSTYFGVEKKYFGEITEEDRDFLISKGLYLRQDCEREVYTFAKQGEIEDDFKYRPFYFMDFDNVSFDEKMIQAKQKKSDTYAGIEEVMGYFGKPDKIIEVVSAINRGCKVYDALTAYLRKMPTERPGATMLYYNIARDVLYSLLLANDLMSREELDAEFNNDLDDDLYDDREWIYELSTIFKKRYDEKKDILEQHRIQYKKEQMKKQNQEQTDE